MDKPFIAYAGIDKITIGNGRNGKAYDVSVELAAAAPALLEALEEALRWLDVADRFKYPDGFRQGQAPSDARNKARAAIAQAKGESNG